MNTRIKAVRTFVGLTQPAFGERLGMSRNVVNDLEQGRKAVPEFLILKICADPDLEDMCGV
ncbi:MAG: helix-turn-helix domain-containing protein [Clostridiales bacterium]|nr:helix-turn-helix domain-containing protein [Clostridiales bacterium]